MQPERPEYRGLLVYRDLRHKFSLLYPQQWTCHQDPRRPGDAHFVPNPDDAVTSLLVQGRRLPSKVRPADLDVLREGFLEGLTALPDAQIESIEAHSTGQLLDLDARHTFREDGALRKRWTRLLYQGRTQITLIAQGSSEQTFDYWLPMFNTVMRTVQFADWWSEMTGTSWQKSLETQDN